VSSLAVESLQFDAGESHSMRKKNEIRQIIQKKPFLHSDAICGRERQLRTADNRIECN
jgi:hypothetical protein